LMAALGGAGAVLLIAGVAFAVARARAPRAGPARPAPTGAAGGPNTGADTGANGDTSNNGYDTRGDR
ncbi:hypothetical protein, partial [Streptomyces alkaliphilus]|uniref:hypothetical protein n=1 Tax=Streptomyces alkaliphilus TaxID=1472722 RepID=UPI001E4274E4